MADSGAMTPTTDASARLQRWSREVTVILQEEDVIRPTLKNLGKAYQQINHRVITPPSVQTLGATDSGTGLTYASGLWSVVTGTPVTHYAGTSAGLNLMWQTDLDLTPEHKAAMAESCTNKLATIFCALLAGFSANVGSAHLSEALILEANGKLTKNSKGALVQGKTKPYMILHPDEIQYFKAIPSMVRYDARGDGESPVVLGWTRTAHGVIYLESGAVQQSGGITSNGMYVPNKALGYGFNSVPDVYVTTEKVELGERVIAAFQVATVEIVDAYGVEIRSPII